MRLTTQVRSWRGRLARIFWLTRPCKCCSPRRWRYGKSAQLSVHCPHLAVTPRRLPIWRLCAKVVRRFCTAPISATPRRQASTAQRLRFCKSRSGRGRDFGRRNVSSGAIWHMDDLGTIAVGKAASLLVLQADPLQKPQTLAQPLAVYLDGVEQ